MPYWFEADSVSTEVGGRRLTIETGKMAKQAAGAAVVTYGDTAVLATVARAKAREGGSDGEIPSAEAANATARSAASSREVVTCRWFSPVDPVGGA